MLSLVAISGMCIIDLLYVLQVCYHVLGLVHAMWPPLPQSVRSFLPHHSIVLYTRCIWPFGLLIGLQLVFLPYSSDSIDGLNPLSSQMKDYIATPKPNGYQSLHTTVIPFGTQTYFPLEIQVIRKSVFHMPK